MKVFTKNLGLRLHLSTALFISFASLIAPSAHAEPTLTVMVNGVETPTLAGRVNVGSVVRVHPTLGVLPSQESVGDANVQDLVAQFKDQTEEKEILALRSEEGRQFRVAA